jgi:hypothetical protein
MNAHKSIIIAGFLLTMLSLWGSLSMLWVYNVGSKYTVENICTETLGVRVTIGELHLNSEQGTARLGHVQIFNPKGFSDGAAVEIENIDVKIESSARGLIRLSEIAATNVQFNLEVLKTRNNIAAITYKVDSMKPKENPSDIEKLKIMIDAISVQESRVRPRDILIAHSRSKTVMVPDIRLSQIGYTENGLYMKQAIAQIWHQIVPEFEKVARDSGFMQGMQQAFYEDLEKKEVSHGEEFLIGE